MRDEGCEFYRTIYCLHLCDRHCERQHDAGNGNKILSEGTMSKLYKHVQVMIDEISDPAIKSAVTDMATNTAASFVGINKAMCQRLINSYIAIASTLRTAPVPAPMSAIKSATSKSIPNAKAVSVTEAVSMLDKRIASVDAALVSAREKLSVKLASVMSTPQSVVSAATLRAAFEPTSKLSGDILELEDKLCAIETGLLDMTVHFESNVAL